MIVYDVATKILGTEFPQHNIVDLNSGITLLFQSGEAFTVKGKKRTHAPHMTVVPLDGTHLVAVRGLIH